MNVRRQIEVSGIVQGVGYIEKEFLKIEALCKSDCEPVDKSKSLDESLRPSDNYEIFSSTYVDRRRIQRDVGRSRRQYSATF